MRGQSHRIDDRHQIVIDEPDSLVAPYLTLNG